MHSRDRLKRTRRNIYAWSLVPRSHGGLHSRMKKFTESKGWSFAPVQFTNSRDAGDWKRLWKVQVGNSRRLQFTAL